MVCAALAAGWLAGPVQVHATPACPSSPSAATRNDCSDPATAGRAAAGTAPVWQTPTRTAPTLVAQTIGPAGALPPRGATGDGPALSTRDGSASAHGAAGVSPASPDASNSSNATDSPDAVDPTDATDATDTTDGTSESSAEAAEEAESSPARVAGAALQRLLLDGRDADDNDFLIGVAMSAGPSYSGASDTTSSIRPAARLTWRGYSISTQSVARASARVESTSGGERTGISGPLRVRNRFSYGFGATINRGRNVSAEGAEIGLKSLPSTIFGRLRLRYALDDQTSLSATLIGDILNRQQNIELPISIGRHYVLADNLLLGLNAGMNIVNRRSMNNDYGIDAQQSAASGKPIYQPKAGIREFAVSATLIHEPDNHWIWMTQFSLVRLVGDAARSPLVRQKLQPNLMFGVAYRIDWN